MAGAPPTLRLEGRVALVTGGARGIGAAISRRFAAEGAVVAAGYSANREPAAELEAQLRAEGATVSIHQGNVGDPDACQRVFDEVVERHGRVDVLVNNAGITLPAPVWQTSVEDWHRVLRVNLSGAFYLCKPALEHMLERGSGRIVNISSVVGETGHIGQGSYAASKSGMVGLTRTLAREAAMALGQAGRLGADEIGVTVNVVAPGFIETDMVAPMSDRDTERVREQIPLRRFGRAEDVARVVAFLAEDASAYVTGQVWAVNGGMDM